MHPESWGQFLQSNTETKSDSFSAVMETCVVTVTGRGSVLLLCLLLLMEKAVVVDVVVVVVVVDVADTIIIGVETDGLDPKEVEVDTNSIEQ